MDTNQLKIYIAKYEPDRVGGGWSFVRNLVKGMSENIEQDYAQADVYLIPSPSMVSRDEVQQARSDGKKIVLRIDNAVRNSRNRNTGMSRMYDFAQWADLIIYQSRWAEEYLKPFLKKPGTIILNGVDTTLYSGPNKDSEGNFIFYSRFNRDETKNWEVARYWFSRHFIKNPQSRLYIAGQFSPELTGANFDFYNNESYQYLGVLPEKEISDIYRMCGKFLYTYYNDACSNSLIEALVTGCQIVGDKYYRNTGGATEIREAFRQNGRDYFSLERMSKDYLEAIKSL